MQTARVQWLGKERFVAQAPSGHMVALDSDRSSNGAPGPMELLLIALGACTATDVVAVLAKKRQKVDSLEVEVSGEQAAEPQRCGRKSKSSTNFAASSTRTRWSMPSS